MIQGKMNNSIRYIVFLLIILSTVVANAQTIEKPDFFVAPLVEIIGYGMDGWPSFGAGFALGAGNGVAVGARFMYGIDTKSIHFMELAVFMRFYLQGPEANTGSFVQLNAGAAIFGFENAPTIPAKAGTVSLGIAAGWRFPLGTNAVRRWYVEPAIRAGYPYSIGAGASFAFCL
jgi:hypothetical protein